MKYQLQILSQLETSHPVKSTARNKSPCREFNYISSHPVESSARNKMHFACTMGGFYLDCLHSAFVVRDSPWIML